jgi:hypothetical protein
MTWETTTTDTDQGVGKVWANHGTLSSATVLYFDDVERNSVSINALIDSLDDPTASNSAMIYIQEAGSATAGVVFKVSGGVTSASTYSKVAVTHVATFGTLSDGDVVGVTFAFSGNDGGGGTLDNIVEDTTPQLGGALDGQDNTVSKVNLLDYGEVTNAIGATGGGAQDIDLTLGNNVVATVDTSANTFTFSNPTASDELCGFTLFLTNGGSQTVTWPAAVDWAGASAPTLTTSGLDILVFITTDGGTIWHGMVSSADSS